MNMAQLIAATGERAVVGGEKISPRYTGLWRARHVRAQGAGYDPVRTNRGPMSECKKVGRVLGCAVLAAFALATSACANVAAYERGKLAHPTMTPSDAASAAREHVYAIQEGALGGSVGVSSGCGCN